MASQVYRDFVASITEPILTGEEDWQAARTKLEALHGHPLKDTTHVVEEEVGGVPCRWVMAAGVADHAPVLFFCHGGAFVAVSGRGYDFYAEMLSEVCGARVFVVDYRLAPEHCFPAALDDCAAAYDGLVARLDPARIVLIGDSCGGGLVLSLLQRVRAEQRPSPAAAVCLGGWFDLEARHLPSDLRAGADPFAHPDFIRARGRDYAGAAADLRDPLLSPIHADFNGFPPLLLQVGGADLTREEARIVAERARAVGVEAVLDVEPDAGHGFQGLRGAGIPEADAALQRVAAFMREVVPA